MLPELIQSDTMVLRKPQGVMPTERQAIELVPVRSPWEVWIAGRPKTLIYGAVGRQAVRVGYARIIFDVTAKIEDLNSINVDDQEYPIAIVQVTSGSIIAHIGVARLMGAELEPGTSNEMNGIVMFEASRISRLADSVVPAHG